MDWFKVHHGMPFDPKYAVVAKRAGVPRACVVAVWAALMDCASQNDVRGKITGFDAETVAVSLDMEQEQVEAIVSAMRARDMIEGETLCNWEKRQTGTSTERVRRYRERKSVSGNAVETETKPYDLLRNSTETIDKRREEQNREDPPLEPPQGGKTTFRQASERLDLKTDCLNTAKRLFAEHGWPELRWDLLWDEFAAYWGGEASRQKKYDWPRTFYNRAVERRTWRAFQLETDPVDSEAKRLAEKWERKAAEERAEFGPADPNNPAFNLPNFGGRA